MMHRTLRRGVLLAGVLVCVAPLRLSAQAVGTLPSGSPFRDLDYKHDWSILIGPSIGGRDAVDVASHGGFSFTTRYDLRLGSSPVQFTSRLSYVGGERRVLRPQVADSLKLVGTKNQPLYIADLGFTLNLTGNKSWRSLVPSVNGGLGLVSDFSGSADSSGYRFGSRFTFLLGAGLKYVPRRSPWTVRADLTNYFYSVKYPPSFQQVPLNSTLTPITRLNSDWVRNTLVQVGITRQLFR
jgi:hypothetical protein